MAKQSIEEIESILNDYEKKFSHRMSSSCIAIFLNVSMENGLDVNLEKRGVFQCSNIAGQRKFLKEAQQEVGCVFVNGSAPDGKFAIALPCTPNNFEKFISAVSDE